MGSFNFKSAGTTQAKKKVETLSRSAPPIGIKTPLELGEKDGIFKMHHAIDDTVGDNLRNLILTNWGERLGLYAFGANLRPLLADWKTQDEFDTQAIQRISNAVLKWMPYVNLGEFSSRLETIGSEITVVIITVTYNIPSLNVSNKKIEVLLRLL
jgi:phage baseplate assembly protein W